MTRPNPDAIDLVQTEVGQLRLALNEALTSINEIAHTLTFLAKGCHEREGLDEHETRSLSGALECLSLMALRLHEDLHPVMRTRS